MIESLEGRTLLSASAVAKVVVDNDPAVVATRPERRLVALAPGQHGVGQPPVPDHVEQVGAVAGDDDLRRARVVQVDGAEQPAEQIGIRRMALVSKVGAADIRAGRIAEEQWSRITVGMRGSKDRPIWIHDQSALTLDELVAVAPDMSSGRILRADVRGGAPPRRGR